MFTLKRVSVTILAAIFWTCWSHLPSPIVLLSIRQSYTTFLQFERPPFSPPFNSYPHHWSLPNRVPSIPFKLPSSDWKYSFCLLLQFVRIDSDDEGECEEPLFPGEGEVTDAAVVLLRRKMSGKYTLFKVQRDLWNQVKPSIIIIFFSYN